MRRPTANETQNKIREAFVMEASLNGLGSTSVAGVAKRAGVSAGTIYLHFESKEDLQQKAFLNIKAKFHRIMVAQSDEPDSKLMIQKMWFNLFDYIEDRPLDFMFIEYSGAAQGLTSEQSRIVTKYREEVAGLLQRAVDDGALEDLPLPTIATLLLAPAMYLARSQALGIVRLTHDILSLTFERVWLSISNSNSNSS